MIIGLSRESQNAYALDYVYARGDVDRGKTDFLALPIKRGSFDLCFLRKTLNSDAENYREMYNFFLHK